MCEILGKIRFLGLTQTQPCLQKSKGSISHSTGDTSLNFGSARAGGVVTPCPSTKAVKGFFAFSGHKCAFINKAAQVLLLAWGGEHGMENLLSLPLPGPVATDKSFPFTLNLSH